KVRGAIVFRSETEARSLNDALRNSECQTRNSNADVAPPATSHCNSALRIRHSALVHIDEASLNCSEEGEVTHAVTHTPHPTQPSGRSTGCPPASIARARSPP